MQNIEMLQDEIYAIESQLDSIVDEMIEKYGKFVTLSDTNKKDDYEINLVRNYNTLMNQKEQLVEQLNSID
jgi:hypothetical protein